MALEKTYSSTRNACKMCMPLGASVAFKGIRGCVPLIHGSQGCATYIRRYLISHFKEPMDIASSNFSESTAVFGGNKNFITGINNVISQYHPEVLAVSSTCLSETIGEDVNMLIKEYKNANPSSGMHFVYASTPSYQGSHIDGFHEAVFSIVKDICNPTPQARDAINLFPGFHSTEDLRHLKEIMSDFGLKYIMVPDYSVSLDNENWAEYKRIPDGGTGVEELQQLSGSYASVQIGSIFNEGRISGSQKKNKPLHLACEYLEKKFSIPYYKCDFPIGIKASDKFFRIMEALSGEDMPEKYKAERGRLVDAFVDGHKYVFGHKAVVYGEEDFVFAICQFLTEIGIEVVFAFSGGNSRMLENRIKALHGCEKTLVGNNTDFEEAKDHIQALQPEIMIGHSKGYYIARELKIPLLRVGFPIHDRMGGQRILHLGYRGTQQLFDKIANTLIESKQEKSPVGYKYM